MTDRVLLLERAYQGRAMFVKVSCKAGESPVELSHHPELRFRFIPRPHDGAPLIANAVQFEVRLARTRAFSKLSRSCFFSLKKKTTKSNFGDGEFPGMSSYICQNFQLIILYNF